VSTITEWLASLRLSEYADRFAENGIDVSVLSDLTDQEDPSDSGWIFIGELAEANRSPLRKIAAEKVWVHSGRYGSAAIISCLPLQPNNNRAPISSTIGQNLWAPQQNVILSGPSAALQRSRGGALGSTADLHHRTRRAYSRMHALPRELAE
jgi:SAM domain (Sterile alpha motif)